MANPYFNAQYYLTHNPDLYAAGVRTAEQAEAHYLAFGAAESAAPLAVRVGPNPWFDAAYYISSNLDLQRAGLTAKDALAHYAAYGVTEGRAPSAAIAAITFSAGTYATANADVALAIGMASATATPTTAQANLLKGHYLAYGYLEGRSGSNITVASTDINAGTGVTYGSFANDTFAWTGASPAYFVGLGGTDTVKLTATTDHTVTLESVENVQVSAGAATATKMTVAGTGVTSLSVANTAAGVFTYSGAKVDALTLSALGSVVADFTGTSGTADALAVSIVANATTAGGLAVLSTKGIEAITVNLPVSTVAADPAAAGLTLNADSVQGSALNVTVTGGKADTAPGVAVDSTVVLNSASSPTLTTVTLNGSANVADQALTIGASLSQVNATVTGGVGDDTLTTNTAVGHTATLNGGAGIDTLVASLGQDTLTGGAGNDTFDFGALGVNAKLVLTGTTITAFDTVADFTSGDSIVMSGALAANGALGTVGTVATGKLTFDTGYLGTSKTVTQIATDLSAALGTAEGKLLFEVGTDTFLYYNAATSTGLDGDVLVKLTGVDMDAAGITVAAGGVTFA